MPESLQTNFMKTQLTPNDPLSSAPLVAPWLSGLAATLTAFQVDLTQGFQCLPAAALAAQHYPQVQVTLPLLITGVNSAPTAAHLAHLLRNAYPAQHTLTLLLATGETIHLPLATLDQLALAQWPATLYVPPLPAGHSFTALQEIVAHLRAPAGCPWDREQTLQSMRHDLLSECAEVLEAIDLESSGKNNSTHIGEELGDLLMAATLMIQIASEAGRFQMGEVTHGIVSKLIRRHPHVFGNTTVDGVQAIVANWDAIKAQEKAGRGEQPHPLDGVPAALPALEKARQLQSKAAKAGLLDRTTVAQQNASLAKLFTERPTEAHLAELLWQLVALAHPQGLLAEDALRNYTVAFRQQH
jgi:tetrapyrrole methylase family protein / MazG family protein